MDEFADLSMTYLTAEIVHSIALKYTGELTCLCDKSEL